MQIIRRRKNGITALVTLTILAVIGWFMYYVVIVKQDKRNAAHANLDKIEAERFKVITSIEITKSKIRIKELDLQSVRRTVIDKAALFDSQKTTAAQEGLRMARDDERKCIEELDQLQQTLQDLENQKQKW